MRKKVLVCHFSHLFCDLEGNRRLNKGLIVRKVLRDMHHHVAVDFTMCLGDAISEKMFTSVFSVVAEIEDEHKAMPGPPVLEEDGSVAAAMDSQVGKKVLPMDPLYCFTIAVGKKASHASSWVHDEQEVANLLVLLGTGEMPTGGVPVWRGGSATHLFA